MPHIGCEGTTPGGDSRAGLLQYTELHVGRSTHLLFFALPATSRATWQLKPGLARVCRATRNAPPLYECTAFMLHNYFDSHVCAIGLARSLETKEVAFRVCEVSRRSLSVNFAKVLYTAFIRSNMTIMIGNLRCSPSLVASQQHLPQHALLGRVPLSGSARPFQSACSTGPDLWPAHAYSISTRQIGRVKASSFQG